MTRKIDLKPFLYEDLEFVDSKGKSWFIAGDIDSQMVFKALAAAEKIGDSEKRCQSLLEMFEAVKALFGLRHSEEELKGLSIPSSMLIPLLRQALEALVKDMLSGIPSLGDV